MPEDPTNPLAELIRTTRETAGLTLYALGEKSGVPRSRIFRIEAGETTNPGKDTMNRLAKALDIDAEALYEAHWKTNQQPLPGASTYLRSRYRLTPEQIKSVEKLIDSFGDKPRDT